MAALTPEEEALALLLGGCWNAFLTLPVEHSDDLDEFRHGIHVLQNIVLARAGRRALTEGTG